ncbi:succinate dehydrogenase cytochrome b560 subunit [Tricladium varicosporioides]|nr:succinate dehydrogenase cytochrome b560 subunit [Hymenoscyphus varicosporioides]
MLAQRATQQTLRRLVASRPTLVSQMVSRNFTAPMAVKGSSIQYRPVATQNMTPKDSYEILVAQRKNRPTSPHLTIYKPQITWILSSLTRITGSVLSGGFYIFGSLYLVAPLLGLNMSSASMAAAFGAWPVAAKVATKLLVAFPFTFHSMNGIRHLVWDMGRTFKNETIIKTGWTVVGLSTVSALFLALLL